MLGAWLALASGITFGLNTAAIRRGVLNGDVREAITITVGMGVPLFFLACALFGGLSALARMELPAMAWMALAGLVHFVGGRFSDYRATQAIGAALSTPIQQCSVAVSLTLAVVVLGEAFNTLKLLGLLLMLAGPVALVSRQKRHRAMAQGKLFTPQLGAGLFWGALCALCYGTSPILIANGLGAERTISEALAGAFISNSAAAVVMLGVVLASGGLAWLRHFDRPSARYFGVSGVLVAVSQMLLYAALAVAPVSVVVPLQRLSVMFRVIFSSLFNREAEILDSMVLLGISLSMIGALAITIDPDILRQVLPVSEVVDGILTPWGE